MNLTSPSVAGSSPAGAARLRMKPNAPPPQLVMSPVFWPSARILKKHWATSSISSAIASVLPSTIRPALVLCRADTISIRSGDRSSFPVDTIVVNLQNDTLVVVFEERPLLRRLRICRSSHGYGYSCATDQQHWNRGRY